MVRGEVQREITTGKGEVMNLKASIEKESATIQTSTARIEEVAAEIASAEADSAAATQIRNSENADFKSSRPTPQTPSTRSSGPSVLSGRD